LDLKVIENVDHEIAGAITMEIDYEIAGAITMEIDRQKNTLELIASENIASLAVMAVQGSV